jgi:Mn2+/Fe2+ NRAMP family transporter
MKATGAFWFLLVLVAAWPLILVGLFTLARRYPAGVPVYRRWTLWAALVPVWLAGSVYHFIGGATARGILFLVLSIAAALTALDQGRRSSGARVASDGMGRLV